MKKLLFLLLLIPTSVLSQKHESYLEVSGKVTNESNASLDSCWVKIKKDNVFTDSIITATNGKFRFDSLITGHVYEIHFMAKMYSYKFIEVDLTTVPDDEYTKFPLVIDMSLFSTRYVLDRKIEFLKTEPVAKGFYNKTIGNIEWDGAYLLKMRNKIEEAKE